MDCDRVNLICILERKNEKNIEKNLKNWDDALKKYQKIGQKNKLMKG